VKSEKREKRKKKKERRKKKEKEERGERRKIGVKGMGEGEMSRGNGSDSFLWNDQFGVRKVGCISFITLTY